MKPSRRIAILGASRGLGAACARALIHSDPEVQVLGVARKIQKLEELRASLGERFHPLQYDLSQIESLEGLRTDLAHFQPDHIIYMAGGGPFGPFEKRSFQSHQWAWKVTFEAAAWTCHWALNQVQRPQVILIGSSVCEDQADPGASSYGAAKHALRGLYAGLRAEEPSFDLRLFSPGYMDTELLPQAASGKGDEVRNKGVWSPEAVAQELVPWMFSDRFLGSWRRFPPHP